MCAGAGGTFNRKTVFISVVQPLVENSILHGTADEDDFVTITVRATVSENLLTIHISDTGCGFDPRAIKEKNSERFSGSMENGLEAGEDPAVDVIH